MVLVKENDLMVFGNKRKERTGINQRWIIMYVHRISNIFVSLNIIYNAII